METKLSELLDLIHAGKMEDAIKAAAKFKYLGKEKNLILRAKEAIHNPDFYRQLKMDPATLVSDGAAAVIRFFIKPSHV